MLVLVRVHSALGLVALPSLVKTGQAGDLTVSLQTEDGPDAGMHGCHLGKDQDAEGAQPGQLTGAAQRPVSTFLGETGPLPLPRREGCSRGDEKTEAGGKGGDGGFWALSSPCRGGATSRVSTGLCP